MVATASHEQRRVIWPDVVMAGLQAPLGAVMVGYGLVVPRGIGAHLTVVGVALAVLLVGLAALRFGAARTMSVLLSVLESLAAVLPIVHRGDDFPTLVYGFPFLSLSVSCFAFGVVLMATHGDEKLAVAFFMAGIALLILSLLVPLVRGIVKALSGPSGEGTE